jgi:hypothetical protein
MSGEIPAWPPAPPWGYLPPPPPPPPKGAIDQLKDVAPVVMMVLVLGSLLVGIGVAKAEFARLKDDSDAEKARAAQWEVKLNAIGDSAAKANSGVAGLAAQQEETNRILKRLNLTRRNRTRPTDDE